MGSRLRLQPFCLEHSAGGAAPPISHGSMPAGCSDRAPASSWAAGFSGIAPAGPPRKIRTGCLSWCSHLFSSSNWRRAFPRAPRWLIWPLRAALIVGIAPVLLYGSSYLSNHAGPGTADWSTVQAIAILGGLAALLAVVWSLLGLLSYRKPSLIHALCLAITSAGAAITVMLSGYATGGQNGLALAAALLGAATGMAALGWAAAESSAWRRDRIALFAARRRPVLR